MGQDSGPASKGAGRFLIGLGTEGMGDDAVGLRLADEFTSGEYPFASRGLPGNSLDLLSYLDGTDIVLLVDAARMGLTAGDYRFFSPEEVRSKKVTVGFSTHEDDPFKTLVLARRMGYQLPEVHLLGIEPVSVSSGWELSEEVKSRMAEYQSAIESFFANQSPN